MPKPAAETSAPEPDTSQAFARIWKDYQFYLDSANDLGRNATAIVRQLETEGPPGRPLRVLEFGAGMGHSLEAFLDAAKLGKDGIALSIIEHDPDKLKEAVEKFQPRSAAMIASGTVLSDLPKGFQFDLILCTHVLYYVPKLRAALTELIDHLAPDGLLLITIGGHDNANVRLWFEAFGRAGLPVPHHHGASVERSLAGAGVPWSVQPVPVSLEFSDTEEHRLKLLRFLFGPDLAGLPRAELLASYDAHAKDGIVHIDHADWLFTVRKPKTRPASEPADEPQGTAPAKKAT